MRPEIAVLDIQGQFRVYTEFYRADAAAKTIVLVNGSMATTASFAQTVKSLYPQFNVVLYDQPYAGRSKIHNRHEHMLTKEVEGQILLELLDHFAAEHVLSFSWGGAATLVALAHRPRRVEKAVISSFSPVINAPMRDYLERGVDYLGNLDRDRVGHLVNSTIGKHLPSLFKRFNYRHVSSLAAHEYGQMHFHISHVLNSDRQCYLKAARQIDIPVLFLNGEWDEYTSADDAKLFGQHDQADAVERLLGRGTHTHIGCDDGNLGLEVDAEGLAGHHHRVTRANEVVAAALVHQRVGVETLGHFGVTRLAHQLHMVDVGRAIGPLVGARQRGHTLRRIERESVAGVAAVQAVVQVLQLRREEAPVVQHLLQARGNAGRIMGRTQVA